MALKLRQLIAEHSVVINFALLQATQGQPALAALPLGQEHPLPVLYKAGRALAPVSNGTENLAPTAV